MRELAGKKGLNTYKLNAYLFPGDRGDHLEDGPRGHQDDEGEGDG